ncbi:MAG: hypothetical protein G8345_14745 [Magnetococcales bacterium]|nr:CDP-glycerol glycerophosphotransferase family protein [Magnetococcales bacterium]NGZ28135.1 hypothetical protein [Magnetococcales bacterium]
MHQSSELGNCACYTIGATWHHLLHLMPYVRASGMPVYLIGVEEDYVHHLRGDHPGVEMIRVTTAQQAAQMLSRHDILYSSNFYNSFRQQIEPLLSRRPFMVRVNHGAGNKTSENRAWLSAAIKPFQVTIYCGHRDLDTIHAVGLIPEPAAKGTNPYFIQGNDGQLRMLILEGNPRLQDYLNQQPPRDQLAKQWGVTGDRPVILFTPTYPATRPDGSKEASSLTLFMQLMDELGPENFQVLIKLHPNLVEHDDLVAPLLARFAPQATREDIFWNDYLTRMDLADLLICDHTATVSEFLFFDKPIVFLDPAGACPSPVQVPMNNRYWSYQWGEVVSPHNRPQWKAAVERSLTLDDYRPVRHRMKDYLFANDFTPHQIMAKVAEFIRSLRPL